jgi:GDP-L-fucose synthase
MNFTDKVLITGAKGLVGGALVRELTQQGHTDLVPIGKNSCNLLVFEDVRKLFATHRPKYVFHAAAQVYGILGNMENMGKAFLNNVLINTNVIEVCREFEVKKIVALGTIAAYPHEFGQNPIKEEIIFNGRPHVSEQAYAQAKRAMLAQLEAYKISYGLDYAFAISTNLYGEGDRFHKEWAHVIPSLIQKFHEAKAAHEPVRVWGDGSSTRDFLHVSDAARALILIMHHLQGAVNVASGALTQIKAVVSMLQKITNHDDVAWDVSKPMGQTLRQFDVSKLLGIGFTPQIEMKDGLAHLYDWYGRNLQAIRTF